MDEYSDVLLGKDFLSEPVTDTKVELARQLFVSLESQVMLADRKVQAVFGFNAFLVAALSLQNQASLYQIAQGGFTLNITMDLLLKGAFLASVCVATASAVRALTPRMKEKRIKNGATIPSLFFFGDIRAQTLHQFSAAFIGLTNEEAVRELLASSYSVSGILNVKYKMLQRSTLYISAALFVWILLQVNKFLG